MLLNMPLGMISIAFGIRGENAILYPGPDQAVVCLDMALRGIRAGRFLRALVGGITHGVSLLPVCTLRRLGRLASSLEAAQPYRPRHAGYAPADAAGFLVVESERSAAERGARPLAVLETAVTHQPIDSGSGARVRSLAASWRESADGVPPDLLVSTGTLDYEEDRDVLRALESAWPACSPPITSFDGLLGYQGAASVPSLVALSTQMLAGGDAAVPLLAGSEERSRTGFAAGDSPSLSPARIVISASHPDGAHCVVRLRRAGGPG
jgi:3-oxoacyl-(acyl-carrier-protein) synthase